MPRSVLIFVVAVFCCTPLSLRVALSAPPPQAPVSVQSALPTRDSRGLSIIQSALTAMGGVTAIGAVQNWQILAQAQGSPQMGGMVKTVRWEQSGAEFRMSSTFAATGKTNATVTGHGSPATVQNGATAALPSHVVSALFIPALAGPVLLNEVQNTNYSVEDGGTQTLNSKSVVVVRTMLPTKPLTAQTWYFDATTNLPVRVEYRLPTVRTAAFSLPGAADFSNFRPVAGILYPFQIVTWRQGLQVEVITLQSVSVNAAVSPNDFDAAGGAR